MVRFMKGRRREPRGSVGFCGLRQDVWGGNAETVYTYILKAGKKQKIPYYLLCFLVDLLYLSMMPCVARNQVQS